MNVVCNEIIKMCRGIKDNIWIWKDFLCFLIYKGFIVKIVILKNVICKFNIEKYILKL